MTSKLNFSLQILSIRPCCSVMHHLAELHASRQTFWTCLGIRLCSDEKSQNAQFGLKRAIVSERWMSWLNVRESGNVPNSLVVVHFPLRQQTLHWESWREFGRAWASETHTKFLGTEISQNLLSHMWIPECTVGQKMPVCLTTSHHRIAECNGKGIGTALLPSDHGELITLCYATVLGWNDYRQADCVCHHSTQSLFNRLEIDQREIFWITVSKTTQEESQMICFNMYGPTISYPGDDQLWWDLTWQIDELSACVVNQALLGNHISQRLDRSIFSKKLELWKKRLFTGYWHG